jgi:DNA-directed RNA polymerase specialized sigma24 family protein
LLDPQDWLFQDPCAEAGDREEAELFQAAFEKLSALEKSVVVGKWFLGLSFRQMAKRDRKSPRTLGDAYSGAMMKLTRYINPSSTSKKPR